MKLSFNDLGVVTEELRVIHSFFSDFFWNKTRNSIKQALQYLQGQILLNERGNMTNIEKVVPDCNHQSLQHFISNSQWDEESVISEIQRQVSELIGNPVHGSVHLDESGFLKDSENSVGVKRQYCKRLYPPDDWANDPVRRERCGVPDNISFKTKAELGLEMLLKARERGVPFAWMGVDCFYGQQPWFLDSLDREGFLYIADVPSDTRVWMERPEVEVPKRKGKRGRHPTLKQLIEGEPEPI